MNTNNHELVYRAGATEGTVAVATYRLVPTSGPAAGLARKRVTLWHNRERNAAVAQIARGIVEKASDITLAHGLDIAMPPLSAMVASTTWIAVVVESPEHAIELGRILPDFAIVTAENDKPAAPWGFGSPFRTIFTLCAIEDHPSFAADVIVNAVGGRYPLDARPMLGGRPRLMIEMGDDFDGRATQDTTARLHHYLMGGWRITGARYYLPWATPAMVLDTRRPKKLPAFFDDLCSDQRAAAKVKSK